jgi:DNA-binding CsgD family transcriptional regulator
MRRERAFMEKYSAPHRFDYHTTQGAYLGSILLWREKQMGPISEATLQSVRDLAPFLTFMLSDCIARRQAEDPGARVFTETLSTIAEKENLTRRQQEVLTHGLLGRTHAQTGAALGITAHAVRGHVCAIHRKTDTRCLLELFARYFTPFQDSNDRHRS